MSDCENKFESSCSPTPSVNHLLRASAIVATGVFLAITIVVLVCILHKRRMILFGRFRSGSQRVQHAPALYIWSSASSPASADPPATLQQAAATMNLGRGKAPKMEPLSCVIMAGEERPTHLARPLPRDEFVDVSLDPKLDELERGSEAFTFSTSKLALDIMHNLNEDGTILDGGSEKI